jgi:hypothetical protein
LLRAPYVRRTGPHEESTLLTLTLLVEDFATQLGQPGASEADLRDALSLLTALPNRSPSILATKAHWLPHLEARLGLGERP